MSKNTNKMFFLMSHFGVGGAELFTISLANWLEEERGADVEFLMWDDFGPLKNTVSKKYLYENSILQILGVKF